MEKGCCFPYTSFTDMETYRTDDCICALATGWERSALAVIRISGEGSVARFAPAFSHPGKLLAAKSGSLLHGYIPGIDEVVVAVYRKGHGYTGEEALEITGHGSPVVAGSILEKLRGLGFRQALPGEFTYRAFFHGRMDLTQAEAVEEMVASLSPEGAKQALGRLSGSLKEKMAGIRKRYLAVMAAVEVQLDYSEDELDTFVFPASELSALRDELKTLASTYAAGRLYGEGAKVVLAGPVNAGKSSLFNLILHEERAIVSPVPGTTRDWICETIVVEGIPIRLYDTAGIRESGESVEEEGISRTRKLLSEADLVLWLHEGSEEEEKPDADPGKIIEVWSKDDLQKHDGLSVSAVTGDGVQNLLHLVALRLRQTVQRGSGDIVIQSLRQKECIEKAARAIDEALSLEEKGIPLDIVASSLQEGLDSVGEITGEVTRAEILDTIFSGFCVGK